MSEPHKFTGFGFGPIQGGLFLKEVYDSRAFDRMCIAEIDQELVNAVRGNGNKFAVNVAYSDRVDVEQIEGVELLNPREASDRSKLIEALAESTETATCLPSVAVYSAGGDSSVASLIAEGLSRKGAPATVIYTAENNNHAAQILRRELDNIGKQADRPIAVLNTVIGKMSRIVTDSDEIDALNLRRITPGLDRAFLVESFNRILVDRARIGGFTPGISIFEEKDDLFPFEEAKLYGHNAVHALIGYLLDLQGGVFMADASSRPELMALARRAFLQESGAALCRKYEGLDPLFSRDGYEAYADDLLLRMVNPYLRDAVGRVTRDPRRKLGWSDRLVGTMRLAMSQGVTPERFAIGAKAALIKLASEESVPAETMLNGLWHDENAAERQRVRDLISSAGLPA